MFVGRHCTKKDLDLLIKETNNIKLSLSKDNLESFFKSIARFDLDISNEMKRCIAVTSDPDEILRIINQNVETLKRNVIVDIYEHQ